MRAPRPTVYDDLDRLTSVARGLDSFSYLWDDAGNLTERTYPDGTVISHLRLRRRGSDDPADPPGSLPQAVSYDRNGVVILWV